MASRRAFFSCLVSGRYLQRPLVTDRDWVWVCALVEELEQLCRSVLVKGVRELGDGRGDFEALAENASLALVGDILRPLDEASQVGLGLDVLTCMTGYVNSLFTD